MDHPDGEADVLALAGTLEVAVTRADVLVTHPLEAEVGVLDPERACPVECRVREQLVGEREEPRVDLVHPATLAPAALAPQERRFNLARVTPQPRAGDVSTSRG